MTLTIDPPCDLVPDVVDDGTRREFVVGGLSLGVLLLAGCGDDDSPATSSAGDGFPVTIAHKYGRTTIGAEPRRVVTLGYSDHDAVLALGVTPVAVTDWQAQPFHEWNERRLGSRRPKVLPEGEGLDVERVAAQSPDLILSLWSDLSEADYAKLSRLAPTVGPDADYPPYGMPWQMTTRIVGTALGRREQADRLVTQVERRIKAVAARHPELRGKRVAIPADFGDDQIYITESTDTRFGVLKALGMNAEVPGLTGVESLSLEQLGKLNAADVLIWITLPDASIRQRPTYVSQPVHEQGRDIFEADGAALTFSSVLSIPHIIDELATQLSAAVDRDPATAIPSSR